MLSFLLTLLAVFGGIALVLRLLGSLLGLGLTAAEASASISLADASARRGDVTTMLERRQAALTLRRRRRRAAGWVALWLGLIVVPPLTGWTGIVYPAAALLWLFPRARPSLVMWRSAGPLAPRDGPR